MKEIIKKIWNDSVGSKVIAVGIVGIFSYIGFLIGKYLLSDSQELFFVEGFDKIYKINISIIYVPVILIAIWIIFWIFRKIFKKEKPLYNKKQLKLREFNQLTDPNTGILYKWGVYFDYETPFIADLTLYCTNHGEPPFRFMYNRCIMPDCINSNKTINMDVVKNGLVSAVINEWDKLK